MSERKAAVISVRVKPELKDRLEREARLGPYPVSITDVVERGIELALAELAKLRTDVQT